MNFTLLGTNGDQKLLQLDIEHKLVDYNHHILSKPSFNVQSHINKIPKSILRVISKEQNLALIRLVSF